MMQFQTVLCDVQIGGDIAQVVTNKNVTVPELAVLRAIHGAGSVLNIRVSGAVARDETEERERLALEYPALNERGEHIAGRLFSPLQALPTRLRDIGIDAAAEGKAARERARQAAAEAERFEALGDEEEPLDPVFDPNAPDDEAIDLGLPSVAPAASTGRGGRKGAVADIMA